MRFVLAVFFLFQLPYGCDAQANPRGVTGTYRNAAQGYSLRIPHGVKATVGNEAGPERGVAIHLKSGNTIVTIGEPNSAEYKDPREGVQADLRFGDCPSREATITVARMGKITGAKGRLACENRVFVTLLAFRPHGGPIYWLKLETDAAHEHEDETVLRSLALSFKIIRWE